MKAGRFVQLGQPPRVETVERPTLSAPGDILVRIAGAGVCRTDLHILDGAAPLQPPPAPPFTLGHENTGWVEEVGPGVTTLHRGDPVILHPGMTCGICAACRAGQDMYCATIRFPGVDGTDGGYAEYLRTSVRAAVPLPTGIDPATLAPLADAGITAYHAVRKLVGMVGPDSTVLVFGVGGLGHLGVQLVRAMTPARILAADSRAERIDLATRLGAEAGFVSTRPGFVSEVRARTGGNGVDVVLDFVGEQDAPDLSLKVLRRGGTYSIVGYGGQLSVPTVAMITQEFRILGNFVGTYQDLVELMELQRRGHVSVTAQRYPLDKAPDAIADLRAGRVVGRAVLVP